MATAAQDLPSYVRPELKAVMPTLTLCDDLLAGPERMWERAPAYIKKWPDESAKVYELRRTCEPVFGGLARTISAGVGMLFAKPLRVEYEDNAPLFEPLVENIDNAGTKLAVFAARFAEAALRDGVAILVADFPPPPTDAKGAPIRITAANEAQFNLRPFLAMYTRARANNWVVEVVDNKTQLVAMTLTETATVRSGLYGIKSVTRYRELALSYTTEGVRVAAWRLTEIHTKDGAPVVVTVGAGTFRDRTGTPATALPIAIAYTGRVHAPMVADVPLQSVAYANLGHWRSASNLTFNREVCGFEQLVVTGRLVDDTSGPKPIPGKIKIGPMQAVQVQEGGTVQWIGPSGKGLEQLEKGCAEKMVQMDQQGLGFLIPAKSVTQTATEARLDSHAQLASLTTAGIAIADALNEALVWVAWYEGVPKAQAPSIELQTNFDAQQMDAQTMGAYVALVNAKFPKRAVLEALQAGGRLPEEADLDELEIAWEAELQAQADQAAVDAALVTPPTGAPAVPPAEAPPTPKKPRRFAITRGADGRPAALTEEIA